MKMIKIFDFRKFNTLEKGNCYCARLANLVAKIYPNIQTINCTFYQMYAFDDEKLNIFENLIKDKVKIINISIGSESTVKGLPRGFKEGKMKHSYKGIKINTELVRECDVRPISSQKAEALVVKDINDFNRFEDRDSLNESRILYVYSLGNNDEDQVLKILKEVTNHSKHKLFCFGVTSDEFFYYCMNRTSYEHSVEEMTCEMKGYSSKHGYKSYMQIVWKSSQEE